MKLNYQKPEVSYVCFETEAVMLDNLTLGDLTIGWGVTTSGVSFNIAD